MFERWFLSHPHSVGESYFGHLRAALGFAGLLFVAAMACLIHALLPILFERTASRTVTQLNERMMRRGQRAPAQIDDGASFSSPLARFDA